MEYICKISGINKYPFNVLLMAKDRKELIPKIHMWLRSHKLLHNVEILCVPKVGEVFRLYQIGRCVD